jgi:hypothetical protein
MISGHSHSGKLSFRARISKTVSLWYLSEYDSNNGSDKSVLDEASENNQNIRDHNLCPRGRDSFATQQLIGQPDGYFDRILGKTHQKMRSGIVAVPEQHDQNNRSHRTCCAGAKHPLIESLIQRRILLKFSVQIIRQNEAAAVLQ